MKRIFIALGFALLYGGVSYMISLNWVLTLIVGFAFLLSFAFLIVPMYERYLTKERKRHECFHFVNSFLVTLSIQGSGENAYRSAIIGAAGEVKAMFESVLDYPLKDRLQYLATYFRVDYYAVFLTLFAIYQDQGGDILSLADPLMREMTIQENTADDLAKKKRASLVQWASLWGMSGLILVFVRFGLAGFFEDIRSSPIFLLMIGIYMAVALGSFIYHASSYTGERIRFDFGGKGNAAKKKNA